MAEQEQFPLPWADDRKGLYKAFDESFVVEDTGERRASEVRVLEVYVLFESKSFSLFLYLPQLLMFCFGNPLKHLLPQLERIRPFCIPLPTDKLFHKRAIGQFVFFKRFDVSLHFANAALAQQFEVKMIPKANEVNAAREWNDARLIGMKLKLELFLKKDVYLCFPCFKLFFRGMQNYEVVNIADVITRFEHVLYKIIQFIEIDVGEKLRGKIAERYAFLWLKPRCYSLSLSLSSFWSSHYC